MDRILETTFEAPFFVQRIFFTQLTKFNWSELSNWKYVSITWTTENTIHWRIYTSPGIDELTKLYKHAILLAITLTFWNHYL